MFAAGAEPSDTPPSETVSCFGSFMRELTSLVATIRRRSFGKVGFPTSLRKLKLAASVILLKFSENLDDLPRMKPCFAISLLTVIARKNVERLDSVRETKERFLERAKWAFAQ